ncbi:MAG: hypothetical protein L0241_06695 [Planctomycetia bacterium]|nr:hypothetical protein [Planctomycetia bacterium]
MAKRDSTDIRDAHPRFVASWKYNQEAGLYILGTKTPETPPGWLELTCSALPRPSQPEQREQT